MYEASLNAAYSLASAAAALPAIQSTANTTEFSGRKAIIEPEIDYTGIPWGNIIGDITDQEDLMKALEDLQTQIEDAIVIQLDNVFKYKGEVALETDLPLESTKGDCFKVTNNQSYYFFNGETWDKLSETYDFSKFATKEDIENLKQLYYSKNEINDILEDLQYVIDRKIVEKVDITEFNIFKGDVDDTMDTQNGTIQAMTLQMNQLQQMIQDLKSLDYEVVTLYDGSDTDFENEEKDFVLSGAITHPTVVEGRNVSLSNAIVTASNFQAVAVQDVTLKDVTFKGALPKAVSNYLFSAKCNDYVTIRDCIFEQTTAYNGIEIGLAGSVPKSVVIDNIDFSGHLSNHGINIYGMTNNGVVTISNCHFASVSNVIRISNRLNTSWTLNIINCTCDRWEIGEYGGMILLQDFTSTSIEEANEVNQFSKLTINIQNVIKPDGTKIHDTDLSTICGTKDENQIIYMWDSYRLHTAYCDKYPMINIM